MKTPEEVKKGLECCAKNKAPNEHCGDCPYHSRSSEGVFECWCNEIYKDALACIQQLEDKLPKWISVEERLPETCSAYLIFTKIHFTPDHVDDRDYFYGIEISGFNPACRGFTSNDGLYAKYWMQLPEPPKEASNEN